MKKILIALLATGALVLTGVARADSSHANSHSQANGNGNSQSSDHGKPGLRSGLIVLDKHVYYPGDTINARVTIPSSLTGYWSGQADAYIVVFAPDGTLLSIQVSAPQPDSQQGLATIPTDQLAAGDYQLAFVLVKTGGDPTKLSDWYQGFTGLISTQRVVISATATSSDDPDHTGQVSGDTNGDGYPDNTTGTQTTTNTQTSTGTNP